MIVLDALDHTGIVANATRNEWWPCGGIVSVDMLRLHFFEKSHENRVKNFFGVDAFFLS
ncbi:MAG: hypothetical protein M0P70_10845 [Desulfobulbaceae bacterium]|nr:hypothetical protein [Desulfobulbaceae bacterium]